MSFADKATAFKHSIAGSNINKIVCKASSHELAGPKKKHVDFLIGLTNDSHVSMPTLVDMLSERLHHSNWIVAMKALISTHNLMALGNERFMQCMVTRVSPFALDDYVDRSSPIAMEMSIYVRKYSRYLTSLCTGYRTVVLDIYRIAKGEKSPFRTMENSKLLKATGVIQQELDFLLEVEISTTEMTNGVINTAFLMLYKDLIKLYTCYNDALINLLENFFVMKKNQCKEVLECYRKFLVRQDTIMKFLQLSEEVGIDKSSHLNLRQVPEDLLPALESHIGEIDQIRKSANQKQPSPQIRAASQKLAELKRTSPNQDKPATPPPGRSTPVYSMPSANQELLDAQRKRFEDLKRRASDKNLPQTTVERPATSPSANTASAAATTKAEDDGFESLIEQRHTPQTIHKSTSNNSSSTGNELLQLDWSASASVPSSQNNPWASPSSTSPVPPATNPFQSTYQEVNLFGGGGGGGGFKPQGDSLGEILVPQSTSPLATSQASQEQDKKDLNSLAMATQSLSIQLGGTSKTGMTERAPLQWGEQKPVTLTGGPGYQKQQQLQPKTLPTAATTFPVVNPGPSAMPMYGGTFLPVQPMAYGMQPQMMSMYPAQQTMYPQSQNPFGSVSANTQQPSLF